jgi:predicted dehydrogenase
MSAGGKIRLGMVGGGQGAFIGEVHRIAARISNHYDLTAGVLSSGSACAVASAAELGLAQDSSYASFVDMARCEAARPDGIEAAVIVTPNHLYFVAAEVMLKAGIHVICDKPLTASLADAVALQALVSKTGLLLAVTYNYSGYPMVRQAREMVANSELGTVRLVQLEYPQDWLAENIEAGGHKQAAWRTDPARAGAGGSLGDIGSHAFHLAEFVSGSRVDVLLADLDAFVTGRRLDDNAHILLRFANGAKGMLWVSQVASGHENGLRIRVYGDKAGLGWFQEDPNVLHFRPLGKSPQRISRGGPAAGIAASAATRLPAGHPEGFLDGFANLYSDIAAQLQSRCRGKALPMDKSLIPGIEDGVRVMRFIDLAVASSKAGGVWKYLD